MKLISGHWGELVPSFLERLDYMLTPEITGLKKYPSEYYKHNVYLTPSGIFSTMQLEYLVKLMGAEHILFAADYPYLQPENVSEFLSCLTHERAELIAHKNAEKILHIS